MLPGILSAPFDFIFMSLQKKKIENWKFAVQIKWTSPVSVKAEGEGRAWNKFHELQIISFSLGARKQADV